MTSEYVYPTIPSSVPGLLFIISAVAIILAIIDTIDKTTPTTFQSVFLYYESINYSL